jgi:hypothetical protein
MQRAPNMEAARNFYKYRNRTVLYVSLYRYSKTKFILTDCACCSNYTLSLLIGVIAASYGSVPLYKTVLLSSLLS